MAYYNTTREKGEQLKVNWKKAESQDEKVKDYFDKNGKATPSEVWIYLTGHGVQCPITSVRRSITNLTKDNTLFKTKDKKQGIYGRPEYIWSIHPCNLFTNIQ